ncbi:MAG: transposase [Patescibacteria group bacterium]|nr:transposase [Patescibacteria group bacterium]
MGRLLRELAPNCGVYHVTCRGNDKQQIFNCSSDYQKFIEILSHTKEKRPFKLYHYALMPNHYHLHIECTAESKLPTIMKIINHRYSMFHKTKYHRFGRLWEDRYWSELIKDEYHAAMCGPYIELNPVRAGFVSKPDDWQWSSYESYLNKTRSPEDIDPHYFLDGNYENELREYLAIIKAFSLVPGTKPLFCTRYQNTP